MTQRKPGGMSFESWIDHQIRQARERGEFDDLPGRGRPLANLGDASDPQWWARRWVQREKLSVVPPAIEIRRTVERTLQQLPGFRREADAREALESLNQTIRKVNSLAHEGPPTSVAPLDVEAHLERWRRARREMREK